MEERLQKLMARAGIGSRRESEAIIADGRVKVNGRVAQLGDKADPLQDTILLDDQPVRVPGGDHVYVALNKPRGVISSLEDELGEGRTTVRDLVPIDPSIHIYPVGRLDRPSEGLILMTNDGELAHRLTHPRYGHEKVYEVTVDGLIPDEILDQWRRGVMLDGRITTPAPIEVLERGLNTTWLRIILREGRKRQIRRVAAALGHPVRRLVRQRIGPIELGDLAAGQWRYLTDREVTALRKGAGLETGGKSASQPTSKQAKGKTR